MASDFPFATDLPTGREATDLVFAQVDAPPVVGREYGPRIAGVPGEFAWHAAAEWDVLHFPGEADFFLQPDRIECNVPDGGSLTMVEIRLLGSAFSLWLEQRGLLALHASAVVVHDRAVAFIAGNRGGKTSLAATFMQAGFPLLSDDILPIEAELGGVLAKPGYPQMRMWPREAGHFLGDYTDLDLVHPRYSKRRVPVRPDLFGSFCGDAVPLAAIYVLRPHTPELGPPVAISVPPKRDTVFELMAGSFAAAAASGLADHAQRLRAFSHLASEVAVYHLGYDRGLERLPEVRDAIIAHLDGTA